MAGLSENRSCDFSRINSLHPHTPISKSEIPLDFSSTRDLAWPLSGQMFLANVAERVLSSAGA